MIVRDGVRYDYAPVRRRQLERGWTDQELARRSGVSASTISAIRRGRATGTPTTWRKLAAALRLDLSTLVVPAGRPRSPR